MPLNYEYKCRDCGISFGEVTVEYQEPPNLLVDDGATEREAITQHYKDVEANMKAMKQAYSDHMREVHGIRVR